MRHLYQNPKIKFYIGDVRDRRSVDGVMKGVDYIFHAAALKQVPSCEFFPTQAVRTNVLGTENVLDSAIEHGVKNVVVLSTDKACYPINAMGISKAMMEKVAIAKGRQLGNGNGTTICCTRYGNVMASRGSVIPLWMDQMEKGEVITVTDPNMTRLLPGSKNTVKMGIGVQQNREQEYSKNGNKNTVISINIINQGLHCIINKKTGLRWTQKQNHLSLCITRFTGFVTLRVFPFKG